jgi:hypothetical protein
VHVSLSIAGIVLPLIVVYIISGDIFLVVFTPPFPSSYQRDTV